MLHTSRYECSEPPCIHVAVNYSRKKFAVFLETADGDIIFIPLDKLRTACNIITRLLSSRFTEAKGSEVDSLAYEELGALPYEE